jgi:hypothetical protein
LKLFQELGEQDEREQWRGVYSSMIYLIYYKDFVNATMYLHPEPIQKKL